MAKQNVQAPNDSGKVPDLTSDLFDQDQKERLVQIIKSVPLEKREQSLQILVQLIRSVYLAD